MKYRKVIPVRLKRVPRNRTIETLEGPKELRADEHFLARGVDGEEWPIPITTVEESYTKLLLPDDEDGFSTYKSNRIVEAVLLEEDSEINGLSGKAREDYLVEDGDDRWFVKKNIFEKTYEKVE